MPTIVVHVGEDALAVLNDSPFDIVLNPEDAPAPREWILEQISKPDVVGVCIMHGQPGDKVDQEFLDHCGSSVKVISTFSVGFDHIDVKAANNKGIKIGHTPGVLSDAVADICVMLTLMTMRRVEEGIQLIKAGGWPSLPWAPFVLCGPSISHPSLTLGFLGFGRISHETLSRLLAFTNKNHPPTVLYLSSRERSDQATIDEGYSKQFGVTVRRAKSKEELAEQSDVVTVLCNMTPETTNLVNSDFLRRMKKTAVLVIGARGPIVNSEDLAEALANNEIFGAGLDVITGEPNIGPDHPLVRAKNCVVIPHMGSADVDTRKKMAEMCKFSPGQLDGASHEKVYTENSGVRNAINGSQGKYLLAEVKV